MHGVCGVMSVPIQGSFEAERDESVGWGSFGTSTPHSLFFNDSPSTMCQRRVTLDRGDNKTMVSPLMYMLLKHKCNSNYVACSGRLQTWSIYCSP